MSQRVRDIPEADRVIEILQCALAIRSAATTCWYLPPPAISIRNLALVLRSARIR
jgi:hypothetical protein